MAAEQAERPIPRTPSENQENRAAGNGPALDGGNAAAARRALTQDSERDESGDYEKLERESGAAGVPPRRSGDQAQRGGAPERLPAS
ncbi:MAG TPA: hypothetical protein VFD32_23995 [Dehalococcoidia bacterium]|nr:hypothetical protein [Dehalococcoidia bacterium]